MYDIITIGGANIDLFVKTEGEIRKHGNHRDICYHVGEKILVNDMEFKTGGGGTNTAVAFSRLGLKTAFIGVLGHDAHANIIIKDLEKEKVDFLGRFKAGETGYSVILNEPKDRTILVYKGVNNNLLPSDVPLRLLNTKWLYLSSLLGSGLKTLQHLAHEAQKKKIKVALNTSIYLAKLGLRNLSPFLKNTNILILNKDEAIALSKIRDERKAIVKIQKYLSSGGIVVITNGPNPIHVYNGKTLYFRKVNQIAPKNTTGAGDAFASGFVYGIIKGKSMETAMDYGSKESLSILTHLGAKDGLLRRL